MTPRSSSPRRGEPKSTANHPAAAGATVTRAAPGSRHLLIKTEKTPDGWHIYIEAKIDGISYVQAVRAYPEAGEEKVADLAARLKKVPITTPTGVSAAAVAVIREVGIKVETLWPE